MWSVWKEANLVLAPREQLKQESRKKTVRHASGRKLPRAMKLALLSRGDWGKKVICRNPSQDPRSWEDGAWKIGAPAPPYVRFRDAHIHLRKRVPEAQPMGELEEPRARVQKQKKKRAFAVWRKRDKAACMHVCCPNRPGLQLGEPPMDFEHRFGCTLNQLPRCVKHGECAASGPGCRLTCTMYAVLELVFSRRSSTHLGKAFCLVSRLSCSSLISIPPLPSFSSPLPPPASPLHRVSQGRRYWPHLML